MAVGTTVANAMTLGNGVAGASLVTVSCPPAVSCARVAEAMTSRVAVPESTAGVSTTASAVRCGERANIAPMAPTITRTISRPSSKAIDGRRAPGCGTASPLAWPSGGIMATMHGVFEQLGDPKIGQQRRAVVVDQDVGRFDVAVSDTVSMSVGEGVGDLGDDPHRLIERKRSRAEHLATRAGFDVAHRQVRLAAFFAKVIDGQNVGMLKAAESLSFMLETGAKAIVDGKPLRRDLDRHEANHGRKRSLIHRRHAARAALLDDLAWRERASNQIMQDDTASGKS